MIEPAAGIRPANTTVWASTVHGSAGTRVRPETRLDFVNPA
ncbi:hypothetical protein ABZ478_24160 [Streptomyces sp. NPDC005706]